MQVLRIPTEHSHSAVLQYWQVTDGKIDKSYDVTGKITQWLEDMNFIF